MLKTILEKRRERLAEAKARVPLAALRDRAAALPPARDFRGALAKAGFGLIAEVKRASPSKGDLNAGLDPAERASAYARGGADCLSILTEPDFFRGSPEDLAAARAACALPVLRKDFTLDEYHVWEARAMGADAVLLIVAALGGARVAELRAVAREAGVQALVEVHSESELEAAGDADLVGINNRDLATLEVRMDTVPRLAPRARKEALVVAESGVSTREHAEAARRAGARALLVGETLVKLADPAAMIRELKLGGLS